MPIELFDSGIVNTNVGSATLMVAVPAGTAGLFVMRIDRDPQNSGETLDVWAAGPIIDGVLGIVVSESFVGAPAIPGASIPQIGPLLLSGDEDISTDTSWMIRQTGGSTNAIPWMLYRIYEA